MNRKIGNEDGISGGHLIIPWWLQGVKGRDFRKGYHIELFGGPEMGAVTGNRGVAAAVYDGYGTEFKKHARALFGSTFGLSGRGEMIPNDKSCVEIHSATVNAYGVPVLLEMMFSSRGPLTSYPWHIRTRGGFQCFLHRCWPVFRLRI